MKIFLAGLPDTQILLAARGQWDFNRLASYHYTSDAALALHTRYRDYILDSGVFTYLTSRKGAQAAATDWDEYVAKYAATVKRHNVRNYVEVDVDKVIGVAEVERLRHRLTELVGWPPMPVWHMGRGWEDWLKTVRDYRYVCFGAFLTDGLPESRYDLIPKFIAEATRVRCKVHGLGMTKPQWLARLPFYSVDSTSWMSPARFGGVFIRTSAGMKNIRPPEGARTKYDALTYSFDEWVKFANDMEDRA